MNETIKRLKSSKQLFAAFHKLSDDIDNSFNNLITLGKTYCFDKANEFDEVEEFAEQIDYNSTGFYTDSIDVGYLVGINSDGIAIWTKEREQAVIQFDMLNAFADKIIAIELLENLND